MSVAGGEARGIFLNVVVIYANPQSSIVVCQGQTALLKFQLQASFGFRFSGFPFQIIAVKPRFVFFRVSGKGLFDDLPVLFRIILIFLPLFGYSNCCGRGRKERRGRKAFVYLPWTPHGVLPFRRYDNIPRLVCERCRVWDRTRV